MSGQLQTSVQVNEIATLLLPVNGRQLVLPNVTVAEIIPYSPPRPQDEGPGWLLGLLPWRNELIPLVSFEGLNEEAVIGQRRDSRIAILNGVIDNPNLPFCAIVTQGVPRLMRVMADEIAVDESNTAGPAELSRVLVSGERGAIPDIDYIQQTIVECLG